MIHSMTGFARIQTGKKEGGWVIEVRSINHRYFDCSLKIPASLAAFENAIREFIQVIIPRGKITANISQEAEPASAKTFEFDEKAAQVYLKQLRQLQKRLGLSGGIEFSDLIKLPGVLSQQENTVVSDAVKWQTLKKALEKALKSLAHARKTEGAKLAKDIQQRLDIMQKAVAKIHKLAAGRTQIVFEKLKQRMAEMIGAEKTDEDRLYREAALLAEKSDITEEIVRLKSHFELFEKKISGDGQVGRELDFLCQEMHREINTIGSKAQLFEIAHEVVFLKGEVEKIREQVQNVE